VRERLAGDVSRLLRRQQRRRARFYACAYWALYVAAASYVANSRRPAPVALTAALVKRGFRVGATPAPEDSQREEAERDCQQAWDTENRWSRWADASSIDTASITAPALLPMPVRSLTARRRAR
jgi:hypothetical protein